MALKRDPIAHERLIQMMMQDGNSRATAEAMTEHAYKEIEDAVKAGKLTMGPDGKFLGADVMRVFPRRPKH